MAQFLEEINSQNSCKISHLPPELLSSVFVHLDLRDRITTSHVCRKWRDASLAALALLWSSIMTYPSQPIGALTQRFARIPPSIPASLHTRIGDNWEESIEVLQDNIGRLRALSLTLDMRYVPNRALTALREVFSQEAPLLKQLFINDRASCLTIGSGEAVDWVCARGLEVLSYRGDSRDFTPLAAAASCVQRVRLSFDRDSEADPTELSQHLRTIAADFTSASVLWLEFDDWAADTFEPLPSSDRVSFSNNLQTLVLVSQYRSGPYFRYIVNDIRHSVVPNVAILFSWTHGAFRDDPVDAMTALLTTNDDHLRIAQIDMLHGSQSHTGVHVWYTDGRHRLTSDAELDFATLHSTIRPWSNVRHVRVSETLLYDTLYVASVPYDLGQIEEFGIILTPMSQQASWWRHTEKSIFFLPRSGTGCFVCSTTFKSITLLPSFAATEHRHIPQYGTSTLSNSGGADQHRAAIGPEMLRELLGWHFRLPEPTRVQVILQGVELVTHDVVNLGCLLRDFEEVRVESAVEYPKSPFEGLFTWEDDPENRHMDFI